MSACKFTRRYQVDSISVRISGSLAACDVLLTFTSHAGRTPGEARTTPGSGRRAGVAPPRRRSVCQAPSARPASSRLRAAAVTVAAAGLQSEPHVQQAAQQTARLRCRIIAVMLMARRSLMAKLRWRTLRKTMLRWRRLSPRLRLKRLLRRRRRRQQPSRLATISASMRRRSETCVLALHITVSMHPQACYASWLRPYAVRSLGSSHHSSLHVHAVYNLYHASFVTHKRLCPDRRWRSARGPAQHGLRWAGPTGSARSW